MASPRPLTKKQVLDLLSKKQGLVGADLRGIDLSGVCFDGADLRSTKMAECNLTRATFRNSNLRAASLWRSDCSDTVFDGANMEEADLDFTNLEGASFRGAKVKKTIFPFQRVPLDTVLDSVKTGRRIRMTGPDYDDE